MQSKSSKLSNETAVEIRRDCGEELKTQILVENLDKTLTQDVEPTNNSQVDRQSEETSIGKKKAKTEVATQNKSPSQVSLATINYKKQHDNLSQKSDNNLSNTTVQDVKQQASANGKYYKKMNTGVNSRNTSNQQQQTQQHQLRNYTSEYLNDKSNHSQTYHMSHHHHHQNSNLSQTYQGQMSRHDGVQSRLTHSGQSSQTRFRNAHDMHVGSGILQVAANLENQYESGSLGTICYNPENSSGIHLCQQVDINQTEQSVLNRDRSQGSGYLDQQSQNEASLMTLQQNNGSHSGGKTKKQGYILNIGSECSQDYRQSVGSITQINGNGELVFQSLPDIGDINSEVQLTIEQRIDQHDSDQEGEEITRTEVYSHSLKNPKTQGVKSMLLSQCSGRTFIAQYQPSIQFETNNALKKADNIIQEKESVISETSKNISAQEKVSSIQIDTQTTIPGPLKNQNNEEVCQIIKNDIPIDDQTQLQEYSQIPKQDLTKEQVINKYDQLQENYNKQKKKEDFISDISSFKNNARDKPNFPNTQCNFADNDDDNLEQSNKLINMNSMIHVRNEANQSVRMPNKNRIDLQKQSCNYSSVDYQIEDHKEADQAENSLHPIDVVADKQKEPSFQNHENKDKLSHEDLINSKYPESEGQYIIGEQKSCQSQPDIIKSKASGENFISVNRELKNERQIPLQVRSRGTNKLTRWEYAESHQFSDKSESDIPVSADQIVEKIAINKITNNDMLPPIVQLNQVVQTINQEGMMRNQSIQYSIQSESVLSKRLNQSSGLSRQENQRSKINSRLRGQESKTYSDKKQEFISTIKQSSNNAEQTINPESDSTERLSTSQLQQQQKNSQLEQTRKPLKYQYIHRRFEGLGTAEKIRINKSSLSTKRDNSVMRNKLDRSSLDNSAEGIQTKSLKRDERNRPQLDHNLQSALASQRRNINTQMSPRNQIIVINQDQQQATSTQAIITSMASDQCDTTSSQDVYIVEASLLENQGSQKRLQIVSHRVHPEIYKDKNSRSPLSKSKSPQGATSRQNYYLKNARLGEESDYDAKKQFDITYQGITKQDILDDDDDQLRKRIQNNINKSRLKSKEDQIKKIAAKYQLKYQQNDNPYSECQDEPMIVNINTHGNSQDEYKIHYTQNQFNQDSRNQSHNIVSKKRFVRQIQGSKFPFPTSTAHQVKYQSPVEEQRCSFNYVNPYHTLQNLGSVFPHHNSTQHDSSNIATSTLFDNTMATTMGNFSDDQLRLQFQHSNQNHQQKQQHQQKYQNERPNTKLKMMYTCYKSQRDNQNAIGLGPPPKLYRHNLGSKGTGSVGRQRIKQLYNANLEVNEMFGDGHMQASIRGRPLKNLMKIVKGQPNSRALYKQQHNQTFSPQNTQTRSELFNQTFQNFTSTYKPYYALDYSDSYETAGNGNEKRKDPLLSNLSSYREGSTPNTGMDNQIIIDWGKTELFKSVKAKEQLSFNRNHNLKFFTEQEIDYTIQMIQENAQEYNKQDILAPLTRKALVTLEKIMVPMGLAHRYLRVKDKIKEKSNNNFKGSKNQIQMDDTIGLLVRCKINLGVRQILMETYTYILLYQSLVQKLLHKINESLDLKQDDESINANFLNEKLQDLLCVIPMILSRLGHLKTQSKLYQNSFVFEGKKLVKTIRKDMKNLKSLLIVFDIVVPETFTNFEL